MDGWFSRFINFLVGVDPELLARCPARDRGNVLTIGYLLIGVWIWQVVVISVALHVGLARPGEYRAEFIALAALVATLVLLFDSYLVRASWQATGEEQLARAGLHLPAPWSARLKGVSFFVVRLGVTFLLALLTGSLMSLILFKKDVEGQIAAVAAERNAPLVQALGARFDEDTGRLKVEQGQLLTVVATADSDASRLRQSVLTQMPADPEIGLATERVRELIRRRDVAEQQVAVLRRTSAGNGDSDEGARLATARRNLAVMVRDLGAAQQRLTNLQARRDAAATRLTGTVDARLQDNKASRDAAKARLGELDAAIARRAETREAAIQGALLRDPGYVPPDDGLLARLRALKTLTADPFIFWSVLLLDAVFVAIELAAVLSKVMTFVPAAYALMLVTEGAKAGQRAKEELVEALKLDTSEGKPAPLASDPRQPSRGSAASFHPDAAAGPNQQSAERGDGYTAEQGGGDDELDARLAEGARAAEARREAMAKNRSKPAEGTANGGSDGDTESPNHLADPARRGPGRPPGSKNRPKPNGTSQADDDG